MRSTIRNVAILGLLLAWTSQAFAQPVGHTYFVAPKGDDMAAGSADAPLQTLQAAARIARAGDTIIARPGEYAGFVLGWDVSQRGDANAPITFLAQSGAVIVSRDDKTMDGIDVEPGCDYLVIRGFTIRNTSNTIERAGIRITGSNHVTVVNNTVADCGNWGIFTSHSSDLLIQNNTTAGSRFQHGIYVSNSADHPVIRGNIVFSNHGSGIHLNGDLSQGGNGLITNALIEDNIIHDNGALGGSGINCDGVCNSLIRCNLLYGNHSAGISLFRTDGATGSTGNVVVNNTIVMAPRARFAININSGSTGNMIWNNVLLDRDPESGSIEVTPDSRRGLASDFNLVENRFSLDAEYNCSFSQWQTFSGQDRHSRLAPMVQIFRNPGGGDYHLSPASPLIHVGIASFFGHNAPAADLDGNPFAPPWNIGAYASNSPSNSQARGN
jgi:parallel beta-helix repeat protein